MVRSAFFALIGLSIFFVSCEKCMRCTYTYETTTIIQTVNGEVEQVSTLEGILTGPDGDPWNEECIENDDNFSIETWYDMKGDTTQLSNYQYTCTEL